MAEGICKKTAEQFELDSFKETIQKNWNAALLLIKNQRDSYCS
jgi:hypothetical protein